MGTISILVAVSENGVIGRDNSLPWQLPDDLKRFKALTMGHTLIMGRKTYDSIGSPLPGRTSIVISRREDYSPEGVEVRRSIDAALESATSDDIFIIGGAEIYSQTFEHADRLLITRVSAEIQGDSSSGLLTGTIYAKWAHFKISGKGTYDAQFVIGSLNVPGQGDVELTWRNEPHVFA